MGMEWYVARDGETFGPFTSERMSAGVRDGELRREDLVWCVGMADWQPAGDVPGLWRPPAPRPPIQPMAVGESLKPEKVTESSVAAEDGTPAGKSDHGDETKRTKHKSVPRFGFIGTHWRGELTLAHAYWGVAFLLTIIVVALSKVFGDWLGQANLSPVFTGITLISFLSFLCVMTIWQLVGVWRSAGNHMKLTGRKGWATIARLAVLLGVLRSVVDFSNVVWPLLSASADLVAGRDNTPAHHLRLLRNGTEVELAGGMPFGTAEALRNLLDAAPGVQILHLNSIGGRVGEGYAIYEIVRDRKLVTYTATNCVSACTVAFLGGSQRYLATKARLGFHSSSFGGLDQKQLPEINAELRRTLASHGAPTWFIDKALSTSAQSMWYPEHDELLAAKIVTRIVDPDQFGMSGIGDYRNKEELERGLLTIPLYVLIRDNDPDSYREIARRLGEGVKLGKSALEVGQDIQAVLVETLPKYLQVAPDATIQRYYRVRAAQMQHLAGTNPRLCVAIEFSEMRPEDFDLKKIVPEALAKEELAALSDLVREAIRAPQRPAAINVSDELVSAINRVSTRIPSAQNVISEPNKYFNDPRTLCAVLLALYAEILNLPPSRSGQILRSFNEPTR
jgi:hypothetical protein